MSKTREIPRHSVWYAYKPPRMVVTDNKYFIAISPANLALPVDAEFWNSERHIVESWIKSREPKPPDTSQLDLFLDE